MSQRILPTKIVKNLRVLLLGGLLGIVPFAHADEPTLPVTSIVCGIALGAVLVKLTTHWMKPKSPTSMLLYSGATLGLIGGGNAFSLGYIAGRAAPSPILSGPLSEKLRFHDMCALSSLAIHTVCIEPPKRSTLWTIGLVVLGISGQKLVQWKVTQEEEEPPSDNSIIQEQKS